MSRGKPERVDGEVRHNCWTCRFNEIQSAEQWGGDEPISVCYFVGADLLELDDWIEAHCWVKSEIHGMPMRTSDGCPGWGPK